MFISKYPYTLCDVCGCNYYTAVPYK